MCPLRVLLREFGRELLSLPAIEFVVMDPVAYPSASLDPLVVGPLRFALIHPLCEAKSRAHHVPFTRQTRWKTRLGLA